MGAEQWVGMGPEVEHSQDGSPPGADQAGWDVPQAPAQRFRLRLAHVTAHAGQLEHRPESAAKPTWAHQAEVALSAFRTPARGSARIRSALRFYSA